MIDRRKTLDLPTGWRCYLLLSAALIVGCSTGDDSEVPVGIPDIPPGRGSDPTTFEPGKPDKPAPFELPGK